MEATPYRELGHLIDQGARPAALRSLLEEYPPDRRGELSRYVWGMLDQRYGEEEEAALWLYAWSQRESGRAGGEQRSR